MIIKEKQKLNGSWLMAIKSKWSRGICPRKIKKTNRYRIAVITSIKKTTTIWNTYTKASRLPNKNYRSTKEAHVHIAPIWQLVKFPYNWSFWNSNSKIFTFRESNPRPSFSQRYAYHCTNTLLLISSKWYVFYNYKLLQRWIVVILLLDNEQHQCFKEDAIFKRRCMIT